ncbi:MAG: hypothetical protein O7C67_21030 [Gammaproteobacteria bacterium]|nr:hypothetical protein [Gammaproteobacteria bacterium]
MNILRLSTVVLTFTIAVFALGYNPALADKPVNGDHGNHDGDGGNDKTETEFMVEMQEGDMGNEKGLVTSNLIPCGVTEGELHDGVRFPEGCVTVFTNFLIDPGAPLQLRLFTFGVRDNRSAARLFFTDGPIAYPDRNTGDGYGLNGLPVTIIRNGSITVTVNTPDLFAIKSHQPRKGDLVGPIAIGKIVYTPIIE